MPEMSILKYLAFYDYGSSKIIAKNLHNFVSEVSRVLMTKKEDMRSKRNGSICPSKPKMVWIKLWNQPSKDKVMKLRVKYNAILEETLSNFSYCYILDCEEVVTADKFDRADNFTNQGKVAMWCFIDQQLKAFDRQKITLKPAKVVSEANEKDKHSHNKFMLPRPPPRP